MRSRFNSAVFLRFMPLESRDVPSRASSDFTDTASLVGSTSVLVSDAPSSDRPASSSPSAEWEKDMDGDRETDSQVSINGNAVEIAGTRIDPSVPSRIVIPIDFSFPRNQANETPSRLKPTEKSHFDEDDFRVDVRIEFPGRERSVANPIELPSTTVPLPPGPVQTRNDVNVVADWFRQAAPVATDAKLPSARAEELRTPIAWDSSGRDEWYDRLVPPFVDPSAMVQPAVELPSTSESIVKVADVEVETIPQVLLSGAIPIDLKALERNAEEFLEHIAHLSEDFTHSFRWTNLAWLAAGALLTGGTVHAMLSRRRRSLELLADSSCRAIALKTGIPQ